MTRSAGLAWLFALVVLTAPANAAEPTPVGEPVPVAATGEAAPAPAAAAAPASADAAAAPAIRAVAPVPPYAEGVAAPAGAADAPVPPAEAVPASPLPAPTSTDANAAQYCRSIIDAAADARFARQAEALKAMDKQLQDRIAALEAKRAEYEAWLTRREEFARKADDTVVAIYSQMRPDAAAQQIAVMDVGSAAAILVKLSPRTASAILNEMEPATAAQLTSTIAGLAKKPAPAKDKAG